MPEAAGLALAVADLMLAVSGSKLLVGDSKFVVEIHFEPEQAVVAGVKARRKQFSSADGAMNQNWVATSSASSVRMSNSNWMASFSLCLFDLFFGSRTRKRNSTFSEPDAIAASLDTISSFKPTSSAKNSNLPSGDTPIAFSSSSSSSSPTITPPPPPFGPPPPPPPPPAPTPPPPPPTPTTPPTPPPPPRLAKYCEQGIEILLCGS
ncbi:hypothetical protein J437_LFUL000551 [Ladona fulva]|uniref:Uncharacterized protein n=1 Tax=Ladona fulva TaxID=123851 RepID=A0A8K0NX86_LADFU|nr:hypothetical protein J437_LFUL000551 [Ladona fulva]